MPCCVPYLLQTRIQSTDSRLPNADRFRYAARHFALTGQYYCSVIIIHACRILALRARIRKGLQVWPTAAASPSLQLLHPFPAQALASSASLCKHVLPAKVLCEYVVLRIRPEPEPWPPPMFQILVALHTASRLYLSFWWVTWRSRASYFRTQTKPRTLQGDIYWAKRRTMLHSATCFRFALTSRQGSRPENGSLTTYG